MDVLELKEYLSELAAEYEEKEAAARKKWEESSDSYTTYLEEKAHCKGALEVIDRILTKEIFRYL